MEWSKCTPNKPCFMIQVSCSRRWDCDSDSLNLNRSLSMVVFNFAWKGRTHTTWGNLVAGYAYLCCNMSMRALCSAAARHILYSLWWLYVALIYIQSLECRVQCRVEIRPPRYFASVQSLRPHICVMYYTRLIHLYYYSNLHILTEYTSMWLNLRTDLY